MVDEKQNWRRSVVQGGTRGVAGDATVSAYSPILSFRPHCSDKPKPNVWRFRYNSNAAQLSVASRLLRSFGQLRSSDISGKQGSREERFQMLGKMKQHHKLTVTLCLIWAATILYGEMFAFWVPSLFTCSWPHHKSDGKFTKVAIVTDPQLMDKTSFRLSSKTLALELAQFYTDINMRRSFFQSIFPFKPDVVLFLGDYFDGGPFLPEEEWQESLSRFRHVFGLNAQGKVGDIPTFYIPGNHDVGYSRIASHKQDVIDRYEKVFAIRNHRFMIGSVEFISIDAQAIDANPQKDLAQEVWKFVQNVSSDEKSHPRVLLTHIPLYRPEQTPCGPHRRVSVIDQRLWRHFQDQEVIYQNYITPESSKKLLELINPILVLSGHDHDQCTVNHKSKMGSVTEHTVGTISWQQGNIYPSFMLLSVPNTVPQNSSDLDEMVHTQLCFLPCQLFIYMWYLSLFVMSLLALLLWPNHGISFLNNSADCISKAVKLSFLSSVTKEKNEDENCEYEMMWDAEGSMHLVKKVLDTPVKHQSDKPLVERGNAVMRLAARKNASEQIELAMDSNAGAGGYDSLIRSASKSRTKLVIQRVIRTIMMVIVIAAFNVPIYMMLLFKDWIEK